jgi:putative DNA primase/helicase
MTPPSPAVPRPGDIPPALRGVPWVCWDWAWRGGAWTKPPVDPRTGGPASSTDPGTWGTLEQALARCALDHLAGVGVPLGEHNGLLGVDPDHCVDPVTAGVDPVALGVVAGLGPAYVELSPSRTGLRALAFGRLPAGWRKRALVLSDGRAASLECYDSGRYLTVTGWRLPDAPADVGPIDPDRLAAWHAAYAPLRPPARPAPAPGAVPGRQGGSVGVLALQDEELLELALGARNGHDVDALWRGETGRYDGDDSRADLALCAHLYFWTGADRARVDRLFRRSGLMRPKWDERRGDRTYGQRTLDAIFARGGEVYTPPPPPSPEGLRRRWATRAGADPLAGAPRRALTAPSAIPPTPSPDPPQESS